MDFNSDLQVLQTKSLPKAVQDEIERLIVNGTFKVGQKLVEMDLAQRLGVSRGPVREAFRGLEEMGLLRLSRNRGVFVRELNVDEAFELFEVRAGLDALAGQMLALRATDEQIDELRACCARLEALNGEDELDAYFQENIRFHDRIVEMTQNGKFAEINKRLMKETRLLRRSGVQDGGRDISNVEHRQIVEAIASRDPAVAARVMSSHVLNGWERYKAEGESRAGSKEE
jgi:DNA-binding GntR family transcriptional regulator